MIDNIKLKSRDIKGKVKVQLFNAKTGEKTYEDEGENYISRLGKAAMIFAQKMAIGNSTAGYANNSNFMISTNTTFGYNTSLHARYLHITNDSQLEDENEMKVNEPTLAWVDLTTPYADSAENRGNINEAECKSGIDTIEWVCDYRTNQANGTFQSIYTSSMSTSLKDTTGSLEIEKIGVFYELSPTGMFEFATSDENYIYAVSNATAQGLEGIWKISKVTKEAERIVQANNIGGWSGISMVHLNGYIYIGRLSSSSLARYNLTTNTWDSNLSFFQTTYGRELRTMTTDGVDIYAMTTNSPSSWNTRWIGFLKVNHSNYSVDMISSTGKTGFPSRLLYINNQIRYGTSEIINIDGTSFSFEDVERVPQLAATLYGQGYNQEVFTRQTIYRKRSANYMLVKVVDIMNQNPTFFSRRRLPNPVTKTNDQVMKITYTFTFE